MKICALTTIDNKNDYFTHFDEWFAFEAATGFRCFNQMGKFVYTSTDLSNEENAKEVERGIDEIISNDVLGIFQKVVRDPE